MKTSIVFKGIVKGAFSKYQVVGLEECPVMKFEGTDLHNVLYGLAIDEWTFILKVNGAPHQKRCELHQASRFES